MWEPGEPISRLLTIWCIHNDEDEKRQAIQAAADAAQRALDDDAAAAQAEPDANDTPIGANTDAENDQKTISSSTIRAARVVTTTETKRSSKEVAISLNNDDLTNDNEDPPEKATPHEILHFYNNQKCHNPTNVVRRVRSYILPDGLPLARAIDTDLTSWLSSSLLAVYLHRNGRSVIEVYDINAPLHITTPSHRFELPHKITQMDCVPINIEYIRSLTQWTALPLLRANIPIDIISIIICYNLD
jgi:hypothetical protein